MHGYVTSHYLHFILYDVRNVIMLHDQSYILLVTFSFGLHNVISRVSQIIVCIVIRQLLKLYKFDVVVGSKIYFM